jgi:hypothetical protein
MIFEEAPEEIAEKYPAFRRTQNEAHRIMIV